MKHRFSLAFLFLAASSALFFYGCGGKKGSLAAAREHFGKKEYFLAGENYKAVYSKTKDKDQKLEACFYTAECYRIENDMKNAENWYRKTVKTDPKNAEAQLRLAESLKSNQKFSDAIIEFKNYQKLTSEKADYVEKNIKGCEYALKWKNEKTRYLVENVKNLNTKWEDFAAMWFRKDQLYFTSDREKGVSGSMYGWTGNKYTDLYTTTYKTEKKNPNAITGYSMPVLVDKDKLNGKLNDGTACFDAKFTTIYFTKCNYGESASKPGKSCRIYTSTITGQEWSAPEPLPFSTDSFNCGHPSLSKDGSTLYFSSDMPGGEGGKDIYAVSFVKRGKTWGDPVNLGSTVNTAGDDMYPYIHEDGTLYFSSNGHVGLGGTDIYFTKGVGKDWSEPINLKTPINSGGDDFAIIMSKDKESGFFTSNREGGKGQDDIYRFTMTPLRFTLSGVIRNTKTREVIPNALVSITSSSDTGKILIRTDNTGSYKLILKPKTDYELFAAKEDYYDSKLAFQTTRPYEVSMDLVQDLDLTPFNFDSLIVLEGIYYGLDSADLRPVSRQILDTLVLTLTKYPRVRLELGSHTDCRADSAYNAGLSQRRADSAVNYIRSKGIDSNRVFARGYGESRLAVEKCRCEGPNERVQGRNCTEEEHQLNRRTTVKFLDNNYVPPKPKVEVKPQAKPGQQRPGQRGGGQPGRPPGR